MRKKQFLVTKSLFAPLIIKANQDISCSMKREMKIEYSELQTGESMVRDATRVSAAQEFLMVQKRD